MFLWYLFSLLFELFKNAIINFNMCLLMFQIQKFPEFLINVTRIVNVCVNFLLMETISYVCNRRGNA
jgi:hypothetical protein